MFNYYKLLQVDSSADYEIIEMAYKKLAKKYHPDVCREPHCLDMMRKINEAYEVLSVPAQRNLYDLQLIAASGIKDIGRSQTKTSSAMSGASLKSAFYILNRYFDAIMKRDFSKAYELINQEQRSMMSLSAFKNWQHWTSRVYRLMEFKLSVREHMAYVIYNGIDADSVITFDVEVLEFNQIMEHYERDRFVKTVMFINGEPSIYLEQIEVSDIIRRYEKLAKLKVGKWRVGRFKLVFNVSKSETMIFNQLDKEVERYGRYSIPFSLIILKITNADSGALPIIIAQLSEIISSHIRKLDEYALLDKDTFLLLLPSTHLHESTHVAEKICEIALTKTSLKSFSFTLKRVVVENECSESEELKASLDQILVDIKSEEVRP